MMIPRNTLLPLGMALIWSVTVHAVGLCSPHGAPIDSRPNIVIIYTDDHAQ